MNAKKYTGTYGRVKIKDPSFLFFLVALDMLSRL